MRREGAKVRPLDHDVDLPGRFPPRRLVVLGDSAAAGHGLPGSDDALARRVGRGLVAADGRATAVRCVAVDGATTVEVLATQLEAATGADVVVIGVGVNDAVRPDRSIEEAATSLRTLLIGVLARVPADARVVLLSCPDLSVAPGLPRLLQTLVGQRCRALAAAQEQVAADLAVPVVRAGRAVLSVDMFGPDGFHPGTRGHEHLAAGVLARLASN
jgi:lysophospholipase L1-like esterase